MDNIFPSKYSLSVEDIIATRKVNPVNKLFSIKKKKLIRNVILAFESMQEFVQSKSTFTLISTWIFLAPAVLWV